MTRIPAKLFRDFEPGGGLCFILIAAIKYKLAHRGFDFEKDLIKADRPAVSDTAPHALMKLPASYKLASHDEIDCALRHKLNIVLSGTRNGQHTKTSNQI